MGWLFHEIIYRPLLNLTVVLYGTVGFGDLGTTIVLMTVAVRTAMLPLSLRTARSQKAMAQLAPEIERLKQQHKGDMNAQSDAVMRLYRERGVSPLSGCLPLLIQFPLLIGLYRVFTNVFKPDALSALYPFVHGPAAIGHTGLGLFDVSAANPFLAVTAGILQFLQVRMSLAGQPQNQPGAAMNRQMVLMLPVIIVVIGWNLPAGLTLYWVVTTLFSIGEQLYLKRT